MLAKLREICYVWEIREEKGRAFAMNHAVFQDAPNATNMFAMNVSWIIAVGVRT